MQKFATGAWDAACRFLVIVIVWSEYPRREKLIHKRCAECAMHIKYSIWNLVKQSRRNVGNNSTFRQWIDRLKRKIDAIMTIENDIFEHSSGDHT